MYFFALSQAPPLEVIAIATKNPVTIVPTSTPPSTTGPSGLITATATTNATGSSAGNDHFAQRRFGHDVDAGAVVRFVLAA